MLPSLPGRTGCGVTEIILFACLRKPSQIFIAHNIGHIGLTDQSDDDDDTMTLLRPSLYFNRKGSLPGQVRTPSPVVIVKNN